MANRQIPTEFYGDETPMFRRIPENPIQALMEADFGHEPEESSEELEPLREIVADAVDLLPEEDRWVIDAVYSEQLSLQQIADQLGVSKTHVFRIRNRALKALKAMLSFDMTIRERVNMPTTWEESAEDLVKALASYFADPTPIDIVKVREERDILFRTEGTDIRVWPAIAYSAIAELRDRGEWDSERMTDLLVSKQRDYGHQNILQGGLFGVAIRLSDKIERYANLMKKSDGSPANESIIDTLLDMVGYCVIAQMLIDGSFILDLSDEGNERAS
jgi:predicted DNA-binding protein YlxM (UPF0122 family)